MISKLFPLKGKSFLWRSICISASKPSKVSSTNLSTTKMESKSEKVGLAFSKAHIPTTTPTAPALATPILAYLVPMSITMNLAAESVKHGRMTSGSVATILPTRVTSVLPMMASSAAQHILTIPHAVFSMTRLTVPMWRIRMREATGK